MPRVRAPARRDARLIVRPRERWNGEGVNDEAPREREAYPAEPFRPARKDPLLQRAVPVAGELRGYRGGTARSDLIAGLTVAALAVPAAMAYAELAGLTAVAGLYALLLPTVAYALLGSSRQLIIGPEGSISALVGASVIGLAAAGSARAAELAAMLALLVGACFLVARIARLGWLADYLSRPVLLGYIHGVAIVLVDRPAREAARARRRRPGTRSRSSSRSPASSATSTAPPWWSARSRWRSCCTCAS